MNTIHGTPDITSQEVGVSVATGSLSLALALSERTGGASKHSSFFPESRLRGRRDPKRSTRAAGSDCSS